VTLLILTHRRVPVGLQFTAADILRRVCAALGTVADDVWTASWWA